VIQKSSILVPSDKCGVFTVNTFHLYRGFSRKFSKYGEFVKVSIRKTKPENVLIKKTKRKAIIVRTRNRIPLNDGTLVRFDYNSAVVLKKRLTPEGKELFGPITRNFKKKKFISSFTGLI
jgi:large subunit ribosomal protein L14